MSQQIPHIYIAQSPLHGLGVFASAEISAESIIEICPILFIPEKDIELIKKTEINNYYFEWGEGLKSGALALGYGSIYNHSFEPSAYYDFDMNPDSGTISIFAYRDIEAGEEIMINYNGDPLDKTPIWFETK